MSPRTFNAALANANTTEPSIITACCAPRPEFITPQDGAAIQDCEINAAKRWLDHNLTRYQHLRPVYLGDDLYSRQPLCQTLIERDAEFLLGAKPASHTTLYEYLNGLNLPSKTVTQRRPGGKTETRRYRWASHMPINDSSNPLQVNWLSIEIVRKHDGKVAYRNSFITNLAVNRDNVEQLAACGTAQWKIENESFNLFKNNGYHLQYNFVHEHQSLSNLLLTLNLPAFTSILPEINCGTQLGQHSQGATDSSSRLTSINNNFFFQDWQELLTAITSAHRVATLTLPLVRHP